MNSRRRYMADILPILFNQTINQSTCKKYHMAKNTSLKMKRMVFLNNIWKRLHVRPELWTLLWIHLYGYLYKQFNLQKLIGLIFVREKIKFSRINAKPSRINALLSRTYAKLRNFRELTRNYWYKNVKNEQLFSRTLGKIHSNFFIQVFFR